MFRTHAVLAAALSCCFAFVAGATTITFDDLTGSGPVFNWTGNQYASQGVLFSTNGVTLFCDTLPANGPHTAPNVVGGSSTQFTGYQSDRQFIAEFFVGSTPVATDFVDFYVVDGALVPEATWTVEFYGLSNNLLSTYSSNLGTFGSPELVIFVATVPIIHKVVFTPSTDWEAIDTFRFGDVPAPGAAITLGCGAIFASRRKRR